MSRPWFAWFLLAGWLASWAPAQNPPPVITQPIQVWWGSYRNNEDLTNASSWTFVQQNMDGYLLHGAYWNYSNNTIGSPSPNVVGPALAAILQANQKPAMVEHLLAGEYPDVSANFGQNFAGNTNDPAGFTSGIGNLRRIAGYGFNVTEVSTDYIMSTWNRSMRFHPDWTSQEFFTALSGNWETYAGTLLNKTNGSSDRNTYGWFRQWVERLAQAFPNLRVTTVNSPVYFSWDDNGDVLRELGDTINSYSTWLKLERRGTNVIALLSADGDGWQTLASTHLNLGPGTMAGFFVASLGSRLAEGRFDNLQTLPFFEQDIGTPGLAGNLSLTSTNFTLTATGDDYLHGSGATPTRDACYYVYTERNGDETWTVRLDSLSGSNINRTNAAGEKPTAGLTVRESSASTSRQISLHYTLARTLEFTLRSGSSGNLTHVTTALTNLSAPRWLRLARTGNSFTASHSSNGTTWSNVGTATLSNAASKLLVGLVADSQVRYETATAVFSQCSFLTNQTTSFTGSTLGLAGSATSSMGGGVVTNVAAGSGVAGTSDNLRLHATAWTNDGTLAARLLYFADNLSPSTALVTNAQMGLMIRADTNAASPHLAIYFTPTLGVIAATRGSSNGTTTALATNGPNETSIQSWNGSYRPLLRYFTGDDFLSSLHESFTNSTYPNNFAGFTTDSPYRGYQIWGGSESGTEAIRHRRKIRTYEKWLQDRGREHHFIANSIPEGFDTSTQNGRDGWDSRYKQDSMRSIQLHQLEGGRPDRVIFESWYDGPFTMVPESQNGTFANLVRDGIYYLKGMPDPQRLDLLAQIPGTTNWVGASTRQTSPNGIQVISASSSTIGSPLTLTVRLTNSAGVPALPVLHAFDTGATNGWTTSYTLASGSLTSNVTATIQSATGQIVTDQTLYGGSELLEAGTKADLTVTVTPTTALLKKKILLRAFWNPQDPSLLPHDAMTLEIPPPTELLQNGGAENSTHGWIANGGSISSISTNVHEGTSAIKATRSQAYQGPAQDILGRLIPHQTYFLRAWVKADSIANIKATVSYAGTNTNTVFTGIQTLSNVSTTWTPLSGYYRYSEPNGPASALKLYFETTGSPTNTGPIYVDAVSLTLADPGWKTSSPGTYSWNSTFNWQSGNLPASSSMNRVSFLPGTSLSNGTITAQQNLATPFVLNSLSLSGNSPASGTANIQITGSALQWAEHDGTPPSLDLTASNNVKYQLTTPIQLTGDLTVSGSGAGSFEIGGAISGTNAISKTGSALLTLSSANSFSGGLTLAGGTLEFSNAGSLGTGTLTYSQGVMRSINAANPLLTNSVLLQTNPSWEGVFSLSSSLLLNADRTFDVATNGIVTLSGVISDDLASRKFIKTGSGTLVLSASNNFRGYLTLNGGILRATHPQALGSTNGIDIQGGSNVATLELSGGLQVQKPIQLVMHTQNNSSFSQIRNLSGTNVIAETLKLNGGGSRWDISSAAGTLLISGVVTNLNAGADSWRTLHLAGPGLGHFSGPMSDGGTNGSSKLNLTVLSGDWTLSGSNKAYTGSTVVSNGVLRVHTGLSSLIDVKNSGTLAGTGSTSTNLLLTNGSTVLRALTNWASPGSAFTAARVVASAGTTNWTLRLDGSSLTGFTETNKTVPILTGTLSNITPPQITIVTTNFPGQGSWTAVASGSTVSLEYSPAVALSAYDAWKSSISWGAANNTDGADPDGDGLSNFMEYALGLNPLARNTGPSLGIISNRLSLTFSRTNDPALLYEVIASATLTNWTETVWSSTGTANTNGAVTVNDTNSIGSQSKRFLRLKVSK
jgi:autotransporter-associated beta strand protein